MEQTEDRTLTTPEAAKVLGCSSRALYNWAKEGKVPHGETPGGHFRFRESVVEELKEKIAGDIFF